MFQGNDEFKGFGDMDQGLSDRDVEEIVHLLDNLPLGERTSRAMKIASRFLEYAAYELAGHQPATFVAELVDASARFETSSSEVLAGAQEPIHTSVSRIH